MLFDAEEYAQAIDDFLIKMGQIADVDNPAMGVAIRRICTFLRISRVEFLYYKSLQVEKENIGQRMVLFDNGDADESRVYSFHDNEIGGGASVYNVYQTVGEQDWEDWELDKVKVFTAALVTFNSRAKVTKITESLMYKDQELEVYNLRYFLRKASELISKNRIGDYAGCYFNLRRFSVINQQVGRRTGTEVMKLFVKALQRKLSKDEYVCRIGGDNFVVLFLKSSLDTVMSHLNGTEIRFGPDEEDVMFVVASAGYYMIPGDCPAATTIMDNLSVAINSAKNLLETTYVFFDNELEVQTRHTKEIEDAFPSAIANEEFKVFYQPKIMLKDYRLAGAEALCRWVHNGTMISPADFIPILEQTKSICLLDFYMLEHVCKDLRRWLDSGLKVVKISVNFSRRHFGDATLLEHILEIVDKYQIPHHYIEIELTETTTDVNFRELREIVVGLHEQGISTSVDDFGIGYSSLNLIKELPWNVLKIDKSFLPEAGDEDEPKKYIMLKHLIALAQDIGLECIVEGVETVEQVQLLKENNCYLAQGFFFDRPFPVEQFEKRLMEYDRDFETM